MSRREHWWEKSRLYYVCIMITIMLAYGFAMTHFSIGRDDEAFNYYFNQGGLLKQGRVLNYVLMKFINVGEYLPIWRELVGLILMVIGIMILGHLFYKLSDKTFGVCEEILFSCTAISFPYIASLFVFSMSVVSWGLAFLLPAIIISLLLDRDLIKNKICRWGCLGGLTVLGMLDEQVIINTGIFFVISLVIITYYSEEKESFRIKRVILESGKVLGILLTGLCSRVILVYFIQKIENIQPDNYTSNYIVYDFSLGLSGVFQGVITILNKWFFNSTNDEVIRLFRIFAVLVLFLAVWGLIKKRNITFSVLSLALIIAAIAWPLITGKEYLDNRVLAYTGVTIGFGIAWFFHVLLHCFAQYKRIILTILGIVCFYIIFNQTQYMNRIFLTEYICCEQDRRVIERIGEDLKAYGNKCVVFVGFPKGVSSYNIFLNTKSLFYVDRDANIKDEVNGVRLPWDFDLYGYNIKSSINPDVKEILRDASGMNNYPADGYIKETDKYIIVRLGDAPWEEVDLSDQKILHAQNDVLCTIDTISYNDKSIYVVGWAFIKGENSNDNKYFIILENNKYTYRLRTQQVERRDVTEAFDNEANYNMSGFITELRFDNYFEPGDYEVKLILEKNGILYENNITSISIE